MMKRLFLDVHALQNMPPSNVNRDDTGSPKTAQYGGVRRARVSSQSWKRAMRFYFKEFGNLQNYGWRTKNIVNFVASKITLLDPSCANEAKKMAEETLKIAGLSVGDQKTENDKKESNKTESNSNKTGDQKTKALFFISDAQATALAKATLEGTKEKKEIKDILKANPSVDIALFGRMLAGDSSLSMDASAQVAHAISTHAVQTEFDFFSAIDDLSEEKHSGAALLDTIEFNSSTLYRYANVALHELKRQLADKDAAVKTAGLFVEAFANSLPTGKINTFANQTVPYTFLVTLRTDRPVNLVSAFETPVRSTEGYLEASEERLFDELIRTERFVEKPLASFYIQGGNVELPDDCGIKEASLAELLKDLESQLSGIEFSGTEA